MRQVVIDIDAGPTECGDCQLLKDRWKWKARCPIYGMTYTDVLKGQRVGHYPRLPACLSAEARLKRLVEAATDILQTHPVAQSYPDGPCIENAYRKELEVALAPWRQKKALLSAIPQSRQETRHDDAIPAKEKAKER